MVRQWRRTARMMGLQVPPHIGIAMDYLEACGLRFCIDFGTDNALDKWWLFMWRTNPKETVH
jgi:hypothetical protein